jgi:hypothetical protein
MGRTILSLDKRVLVITGPRDTTLKVQSWLTLFLMLFAKKLNLATVCKVSKSPTLSVVVLVLVWGLF